MLALLVLLAFVGAGIYSHYKITRYIKSGEYDIDMRLNKLRK